MLDKLDAALRFQQEALNLRAQRQEVLAANIANADTPGYQARDIDFASELKKVMQRGRDATATWTGCNKRGCTDDDLNATHSGAGADTSYRRTAIPYSGPAFA